MNLKTILKASIFTLRSIIDNLSTEKNALIHKDHPRRQTIQKERSALRILFKKHKASLSQKLHLYDRNEIITFFKKYPHPEQIEFSSLFNEMVELEKKALSLKKENKALYHFTKYYQACEQPKPLKKQQKKIKEKT